MQIRLSLRNKLLAAFAIVLVPVLVLVFLDFRQSSRDGLQRALDAQALTAQAIAIQVEDAFGAAIGMGSAVANDPLVQTMDPAQLDPHLRKLVERHPAYDTINVFDERGINRGWGHPTLAAEPRLDISSRPFFLQAMETNAPAISEVVELRRSRAVGVVISVPIRDSAGRAKGVVGVVKRTDLMAGRYGAARLAPGQTILLADHAGRLAFHTGLPELTYVDSGKTIDFAPLRHALDGEAVLLAEFESPLTGELQLGAFAPTPKYGWAVGVTMPRAVALAPVQQALRTQLVALGALLVFSGALATVLARFLSAPVRQLECHARALGRGDLSRRAEIRTGDELAQLGSAFNEMAATLQRREQELEQAQAELLRRERMAALGELAALVAHEVRNPLAVIFNSVNALRRERQPPEVEGVLSTVYEESDRLNRMVGDLLDFARPPAPTLQPTDLRQLLGEALGAALQGAARVSPRLEIGADLPPVPMDPRLFRQALVNVAANAVQAMPRGGTLKVEARRVSDAGREVARVRISDEGPGIAPELRERIFEPFFTTKASGTGLGLAVVKRILEEHHGSVSIESEPGRGTTVTLDLPLAGG